MVACPTYLQADWIVPEGLNLNLTLRDDLFFRSDARLIVRGTASIISADNARILHDGGSCNNSAILVENSGVLIVIGCAFVDFHSDQGGALHVSAGSSVQASSCGFLRCTAHSGGAVYVSEDSEVELTECRFQGCTAESKEGSKFRGSIIFNGSPDDWRSSTSEAVCCFGSATFTDCAFGAAVVNGEMKRNKPVSRTKSLDGNVNKKPSSRVVSNPYRRIESATGCNEPEGLKDADAFVGLKKEEVHSEPFDVDSSSAFPESDVALLPKEYYGEFSPHASFLDYKGLAHLCLEGWMLASVQDLVLRYPYEEDRHRAAFIALIQSNHGCSKRELIRSYRRDLLECLEEAEADRFVSLLSEVVDEFLMYSPCGFGRDYSERSMETTAPRNLLCDACGEEIEPGERIFVRTDPVRVTRHLKCNSQVRYYCEYATAEYMSREIEYFEENLVAVEDCDYVLEGDLSHKAFSKAGFICDKYGKIFRLPRFSEFVFRYVSGEDDYALMREYRPYHMYLEFLFKLKGATTEQIRSMGGYKYLLREDACGNYFELRRSVFSVSYSDLFFDEQVYEEVDRGFKSAVYEVLFRKLFAEMGILCGDHRIVYHGKEMTYAVESQDADLTISVDKSGVYCTDSNNSLLFKEFFKDCPCADQYLEYISRLEAAT